MVQNTIPYAYDTIRFKACSQNNGVYWSPLTFHWHWICSFEYVLVPTGRAFSLLPFKHGHQYHMMMTVSVTNIHASIMLSASVSQASAQWTLLCVQMLLTTWGMEYTSLVHNARLELIRLSTPGCKHFNEEVMQAAICPPDTRPVDPTIHHIPELDLQSLFCIEIWLQRQEVRTKKGFCFGRTARYCGQHHDPGGISVGDEAEGFRRKCSVSVALTSLIALSTKLGYIPYVIPYGVYTTYVLLPYGWHG